MKKIIIISICFQLLLFYTANAQKVIINYYDKTMHVVDVPDYLIHYQSEKEHEIFIEDSVIVDFFFRHISDLKQCDTIPQTVNSLVKIIYEYKNGNFDILTFCPQSPYKKDGICKNGRMYCYDFALDKVVLSILNNPLKDSFGRLAISRAKKIKELISKIESE